MLMRIEEKGRWGEIETRRQKAENKRAGEGA